MSKTVLEILSDLQWHHASELADDATWRFGSPIHILRSVGYQIETKTTLDDPQGMYRLVSLEQGPPVEPTPRVYFTLAEARWLKGLLAALALLGMPIFGKIESKLTTALENAEHEWAKRQKKGRK